MANEFNFTDEQMKLFRDMSKLLSEMNGKLKETGNLSKSVSTNEEKIVYQLKAQQDILKEQHKSTKEISKEIAKAEVESRKSKTEAAKKDRDAHLAKVHQIKDESSEEQKMLKTKQSLAEGISKVQYTKQIERNKRVTELQIKEEERLQKLAKERAGLERSINEDIKQSHREKIASLEMEGEAIKNQQKALEAQEKTSKSIADTLDNAGGKAINRISSETDDAVKKALSIYEEYAASISNRLIGTNQDFDSIMSNILHRTSTSATVDTSKMFASLNKLVESGITENLELRAFLDTVSKDIANTFSVFDSNLIRLIKLQKQDSTAAYMGMEVALTDLFNGTFKDTSYLTGLSDHIANSIVDASAQLSAEEGLAFQYTVQKWLGALSESGASDNFVNTVASGINMLATGDVAGLSGNPQLQSLLAMSAARSGGSSYSDLLLNGMNAENTNELLYSMVNYLSEVAGSTEGNNVLKKAYGDVFNFNTSDLKAITNLGSNASTIYNSGQTYSGSVGTLNKRLSTMADRMPISAKIDNVLDNTMFNIGSNIASNAVEYGIYRLSGAMKDYLGDPTISAAPFGVGVETSLSGLIKSGLFLASGVESLFNGSFMDSIKANQGGLTVADWTGGFNTSSVSGTSSSGTAVGSFDSQASATSSLNKSKTQANEIAGVNEEEEITIEDIYDELAAIRYDIENVSAVNPIVVSDVQTIHLLTKLDEISKALFSTTFDVNIKSMDNNITLNSAVDSFGTQAQNFLVNSMMDNIARRMVNVIYKGEPTSDSNEIDKDASIEKLIELMGSMANRSGNAMDVNLAGSDLTVKDMLVRRV